MKNMKTKKSTKTMKTMMIGVCLLLVITSVAACKKQNQTNNNKKQIATDIKSKTIQCELKEDYDNCVFSCRWENKKATANFKLTSPKGSQFGTLITPDRCSTGEGYALINVGNTKAGTWDVEIIGKHLGSVDISGGPIVTDISKYKK